MQVLVPLAPFATSSAVDSSCSTNRNTDTNSKLIGALMLVLLLIAGVG